MFIGKSKASGIYPAHAPIVNQCTQYRFDRSASNATHSLRSTALGKLGMHSIIIALVYTMADFFMFTGLVAAAFAKRTILTHALAAAIHANSLPVVFLYTLKS